jgi:hypothetical protein
MRNETMTLEEIEKLDCEFLDIPTVSDYLRKDKQQVRNSIRKGVPWGYVMGNADFRIPRRAFISYHKFGSVIEWR